jgi:hypothetical protein
MRLLRVWNEEAMASARRQKAEGRRQKGRMLVQ